MTFKQILNALPSNFIMIIIAVISFIPIMIAYYIIKFYFWTNKLSINGLKQGIMVKFYRYLKQSNNHV